MDTEQYIGEMISDHCNNCEIADDESCCLCNLFNLNTEEQKIKLILDREYYLRRPLINAIISCHGGVHCFDKSCKICSKSMCDFCKFLKDKKINDCRAHLTNRKCMQISD